LAAQSFQSSSLVLLLTRCPRPRELLPVKNEREEREKHEREGVQCRGKRFRRKKKTHSTNSLRIVVVPMNREDWDTDVEIVIFVVDCWESERCEGARGR